MLGHTSQFMLLRTEAMAWSSYLRIARSAESLMRREEALKNARRVYSKMQVHLSNTPLADEERNLVNSSIHDVRKEFPEFFEMRVGRSPRAPISNSPLRKEQRRDFLRTLENKSWNESLVVIDVEYKRIGDNHRKCGAWLIQLCSYLLYPTKRMPKRYQLSLHERPTQTSRQKVSGNTPLTGAK